MREGGGGGGVGMSFALSCVWWESTLLFGINNRLL